MVPDQRHLEPECTRLLYTAWNDGPDGAGGSVIAVPVDTSQPPVVLAAAIGDDAYGGTPWVPIQMSGGTGPLA